MVTKTSNRMINGATVNAKDFGVVGDGVADDTAAIREAIDYLIAQGGGVCNLPVGRYLIGGSFYIPAFITLKGDGEKSVLVAKNPTQTYCVSASANSRIESLSIDGADSQGWGLQVSNRVFANDLFIYGFKGNSGAEDGVGMLLEGAYASSFYNVRIKQCRTAVSVGRLGTTLENNSNAFYNCGFEFTLDSGVVIQKANLTSFFNCYWGHHGGDYGNNADGTALFINNLDAGVIAYGMYTEFCRIGILNEGKFLEVVNGRFSNQIRINSGNAEVRSSEFYGYGAYVDCPSGSTGTALLRNNWGNGYAPIIGPVNYQNRVTLFAQGDGRMSIRNGLRLYGGAANGGLNIRDGGGINIENEGTVRVAASTGAAIAASGGGNISVWGGGDFEQVDSTKGLILKAPNTQRYRVKVDNAGNLITELVV